LKEVNIESSNEFRIAETLTFQKKIKSRGYKQFYSRIKENIYPRLRSSPNFGPNIKRLKGEWAYLYRYRIGDYRLFYIIDQGKKVVFVLDIIHRKNAYR
jgi:mRNA interferase RelE/StbE